MAKKLDYSARAATPVIHQLQHATRQYRIITSEEEIILRTGEQIVRACQLEMNVSAWNQNFRLMAAHVAKWCADRPDKVAMALVELRSDKTVFYIIPVLDHYDFDLGGEQADLDIFLNTRGGIGYSETRQVPLWELDRFVSNSAYLVFPREVPESGE